MPTGSFEPGFNVGTGGRQPGVAIGDGKVYAPTRDGYLVALDQMTGGAGLEDGGHPVAEGRPGLGRADLLQRHGASPATSGGDGGSVSNACTPTTPNNGRQLWSWTVVPQPGAPGSNTWAATDTHYGGGAMWESPVIDTKLNLAIFGTGNPVPWNSRGPGMNLYTDSIVALNVYTGQLVWAYQTAHHDLWDSDLPNNGVLFEQTYKLPKTKTVKVKYNGSRSTASS